MPNTTERKNKKRMGALLSAMVTGGFFVIIAVCLVLTCFDTGSRGAEIAILLVCALLYFAIAGGILLALSQRWKEIDGGEEDEARKY